ncbi:hypothetical protein ACJJI5_19645 [Microbulbifer sp. EKSA008]|uniref:hypothetical protein n=1 Tax=unclassified Microbulbifer TaxID=2619833 RepID=UPI00403AE8D6
MKLYLHIGTEKTGTTTIQEVLFKNQNFLSERGFHFLQCAGVKNNRALPAYCVNDEKSDDFFRARNITTIEEKIIFRKSLKEKLDKELSNLPANVHSVIISSEHFHSRVNTKEEVNRALELMSEYFSDISVICYLREQSAVCESLYSTSIKFGYSQSLDFMLAQCQPSNIYYNYYDMLSNWASAFGLENINPRIFSRDFFVNSDLIDDFFCQLDPKLLKGLSKDVDKENESLTQLGQTLGRAVNRVTPRYLADGTPNSLRAKVFDIIYQEFKGKGERVSQEKYDEIYYSFEESNRQLNKEFFKSEDDIFVYRMRNTEKSEPAGKEQVDSFVKIIQSLMIGYAGLPGRYAGFPDYYADVFRDASIKLETVDLKASLGLMEIAHSIRPEGEVIKSKLEKYRNSM